jgi:hypothetical protein
MKECAPDARGEPAAALAGKVERGGKPFVANSNAPPFAQARARTHERGGKLFVANSNAPPFP